MKELLTMVLVFLLLSQSVSAIEPGEKRQYEYFNQFTFTYSNVLDDNSADVTNTDSMNDSAEYMVEFQRFAYSPSYDIRPPRFYVETVPRNKVVIPDTSIFNYSGMIDRVCPSIGQGINTLYYMGQTIDVGSCLRKNMYYSALISIFTPETFPQNSSVVSQIVTQVVPSIDVEQPLTVRFVASLFGYDLPIYEELYTYQATLRLISTDELIGYSVSARLDVDYDQLLSELQGYGQSVKLYSEWKRSEEVLYDRQTGWITSYQQNVSFSKLSSDTTNFKLVEIDLLNSLLDISPPFLNGIIPDEFLLLAGILLLLVILYMTWRWRRRRRKSGKGDRKEDLYPNQ